MIASTLSDVTQATSLAIGMECLEENQVEAHNLPTVACSALSRHPQHKEDIVLVVAILAAKLGIIDSCMSVIAMHLDSMHLDGAY